MTKTKELTDVSGTPGMMTLQDLADKYQLTTLKISQILKEAEVAPAGKMPVLDAVSKKPSVGKPRLAFDEAQAAKAIEQVTNVKAAPAVA